MMRFRYRRVVLNIDASRLSPDMRRCKKRDVDFENQPQEEFQVVVDYLARPKNSDLHARLLVFEPRENIR